MNLSSLMSRSSFKVKIAIFLFFGLLVAFALEVFLMDFIGFQIINMVNFGLAWFMFINIRKVQRTLHSLSDIVYESAHGRMHGRIVKIDDQGELKMLCSSMNSLLNGELLTKEIKAAITAASKEDFTRKILPKGYR